MREIKVCFGCMRLKEATNNRVLLIKCISNKVFALDIGKSLLLMTGQNNMTNGDGPNRSQHGPDCHARLSIKYDKFTKY